MHTLSTYLKNLFNRAVIGVSLIMTLNACAVVALGAIVVTGSAVHDRRSIDTQVDDRLLNVAVRDVLYGTDAFGNESRIKISIYNGWVLLAGEVGSQEKVDEATQLVSEVEGVEKLFNELSPEAPVGFRQVSRDRVLAIQAKAAIANIRDLPKFDASRVNVITTRGIIYLQGLVTEDESERVVEQVRTVRGAERVVLLFELIDPTPAVPE
jgi:osmotically-inducible protein OsmY